MTYEQMLYNLSRKMLWEAWGAFGLHVLSALLALGFSIFGSTLIGNWGAPVGVVVIYCLGVSWGGTHYLMKFADHTCKLIRHKLFAFELGIGLAILNKNVIPKMQEQHIGILDQVDEAMEALNDANPGKVFNIIIELRRKHRWLFEEEEKVK